MLSELKQYSPDIICFTSTTNQYPFVKTISEWIKVEKPDIPIVLGGIHATLAPEEVIQNPHIDVVCIGEGEYPLLELAEKIDEKNYTTINNLWFKSHKNPIRPLLNDLDSLPFPDYELFNIRNVLNETDGYLSLLAGRGCPNTCTYCCNHALRKIYENKGKYVRFKSVDYLLSEINYFYEKYEISGLDFTDDTFTLNNKWIEEFSKKYSQQFDLPFTCNARIENINIGLLGNLKNAGCTVLNFGIESGNEWLRKNVLKRGTATNQDIINAFVKTREAGIKTFSYNMIGLPYETPEMIEDTITLNKKIKPNFIVVFIFYPYPGTELYDICKQNGWLKDEITTSYLTPKSILNIPTLSEKEILNYYDDFNKLSMESYIKSDYPSLAPIYYILSYSLGGTRTKKLLTGMKYNRILRLFFNAWKK